MNLKLDENLGARCVEVFRAAGHDVATARDEDLCSASDRTLIEPCRLEQRCLVTLDLDFANPLVFTPSEYHGISVIRLPSPVTLDALLAAARTLVLGLDRKSIVGELWVVQPGRIREHLREPPG